MCSIPDPRIARIGQAIDELAEQTRARRLGVLRAGSGDAGTGDAGTDGGADDVVQRLAALWAMMAELDPGLAERLPRYAAPADLLRR
jgi:hypothetical protein